MLTKDFSQWDLFTTEQRKIIDSINQTRVDFPSDATLIQVIQERVEKSPTNIAVSSNNKTLTYEELDKSSNRLARLLREIGARTGDIVAIHADRDLETYVGILAILKAGAAYLPIDPAAPRERNLFLLNDSRAVAVLTKSHWLNVVEGAENVYSVLLDELRQFQKARRRSGRVFDRSDIEKHADTRLPLNAEAADLAYVIYTSGSTGVPKGVMVEHRSVVNLSSWVKSAFEMNHQSRVMQNASLFFDGSVQQIFPAFMSGATLFPAPEEMRVDPPALLDWIRQNRISHWDSVPSLWYRAVNYLRSTQKQWRTTFPDLRFILLAGEPLLTEMVEVWTHCVEQNHKIFNIYGPTEATVDATFHLASRDESKRVIPIGKPLQNMEVYIMNDNLQLCMPNVEGEICIGGVGVARGYLNNPGLTSRAFFMNPEKDGQRIYRTGDFGRLSPDGYLEFIGRKDEQIKISGQRIELSEIERVMLACQGVTEAAVTVERNDIGECKKILAFYVSADDRVSPDDLREYLISKLPGFMIPHHFTVLREFPLNANKKVDKSALLRGFLDQGLPQGGFSVAPTTSTEKALARVWKEVLPVDQVGIDDDFFALDGDSISSILFCHRCAEAGIHLKLVDVFRHTTIRRLAEFIDRSAGQISAEREARRPADDFALISLTPEQAKRLPAGVECALPLLPMQQAMFYARELNENAPVYVVQVIYHCEGTIDLDAFEKAINVVVSRHQALRSIFLSGAFIQPVQAVLSEVDYKLNYEDIRHIDPEKQTGFILQKAERELRQGFTLSEWPLFRISIYQRGAEKFDVIWTTHHIIMDGWSTSIFYEELFQAYSNFVTNSFQPLPGLKSTFKDYMAHRSSQDLEGARRFWKSYISDLTVVDLPKDFPGRRSEELQVKRLRFYLSPEETLQLKQLVRANSATVNAACLSAYFLLLKYICRQDDLLVGIVTSGRSGEIEGIERIIGCLINTVPLRLNLAGLNTFEEVLASVKQSFLQVSEHGDFDLSEILKLSPLNSNKLIESIFIFENYPSPRRQKVEYQPTFKVMDMSGSESSDLPLAVVCFEDGAGSRIGIDFEYAANLFREETIRSWAKIYTSILGKGARKE